MSKEGGAFDPDALPPCFVKAMDHQVIIFYLLNIYS